MLFRHSFTYNQRLFPKIKHKKEGHECNITRPTTLLSKNASCLTLHANPPWRQMLVSKGAALSEIHAPGHSPLFFFHETCYKSFCFHFHLFLGFFFSLENSWYNNHIPFIPSFISKCNVYFQIFLIYKYVCFHYHLVQHKWYQI